jgi:hypothetical protein
MYFIYRYFWGKNELEKKNTKKKNNISGQKFENWIPFIKSPYIMIEI